MISPLLQILFCKKSSKFERMTGCNYSLTIQKGPFIEWMAATGIRNQLNIFEKRMATSACCKETQYL